MNIGSPHAHRSPAPLSDDATQTLADSIVDASLALPSHQAARARALKQLDAQIAPYFAAPQAGLQSAQKLLAAMLERPIADVNLNDVATLVAGFESCEPAIDMVVRHANAAQARNAPATPAAGFRPRAAQAPRQTAAQTPDPSPDHFARARVPAAPVPQAPLIRRQVAAPHAVTPPAAPAPPMPQARHNAAYEPAVPVAAPLPAAAALPVALAASPTGAPAAFVLPVRRRRVIERQLAPQALEQLVWQAQLPAAPRPIARPVAVPVVVPAAVAATDAAPGPAAAQAPRARRIADPRQHVAAAPLAPAALAQAVASAQAAASAAGLNAEGAAPPPYTAERRRRAPSADDGAPGPSQPRVPQASMADFELAQAIQRQEEADLAFAAQIQRDEDACANATLEIVEDDDLISNARLVNGVLVPTALICPVTQALFVNPVLDKNLGYTVDGPHRLSDPLPAHQVRDQGMHHILSAWKESRGDEIVLGAAVRQALTCTITQDLFAYPVIGADGHTYEESAIRDWLAERQRSPMTREPMTVEDLWPAQALMDFMQQFGMTDASGADGGDDEVVETPAEHIAAVIAQQEPPVQPPQASAWGLTPAMLEEARVAARTIGMHLDVMLDLFAATREAININSRLVRMLSGMGIDLHIGTFTQVVDVIENRGLRAHFLVFAAECYMMKKEYKTASTLLERTRDAGFSSDFLTARLAFLRAISGQLGEAQTLASQSRDADEVTSYRHAALGEVCRRQGAFAQALQHFAAADEGGLCLRQVEVWRNLAVKKKIKHVS